MNTGIQATGRTISTINSTTATVVFSASATRSMAWIQNQTGVEIRVELGDVDATPTTGCKVADGETWVSGVFAPSRITVISASGTGLKVWAAGKAD